MAITGSMSAAFNIPGRGRRYRGPGRDHRQRGGTGGARRSGRGVDTAAAALPGPGAAGRIVLSSQSTTNLRRTFPVGGLPPPRMDNLPATCGRHLPLRPRPCNLLQSRHVRPSVPMTHPPPIRYTIRIRMPAPAARTRTLPHQPSGPDRVSNRGQRSRSLGFRQFPKGKCFSFPCLRATGGKVAKCCRLRTRKSATPDAAAGGSQAGCPLLECKTMCYNGRSKERLWPP